MELSCHPLERSNLLCLENIVWVLNGTTGISNFDFPFERFFRSQRPLHPPGQVTAVGRIGPISPYDLIYVSLQEEGISLLHSPEEHRRASQLSSWYPLIEDLTPRSLWFEDRRPDPIEVGDRLGWPVFMKGNKQTCRHRRSLSIIASPEQMEQALAVYARDPVLRSQAVVCREYVRLRLVEEDNSDRLPSSFEFRTFWWKGLLAGLGPYWWEATSYQMSQREEVEALAVAEDAARRVRVPLLVVDVAQAANGRWLVIECNDGQESGYGGANPSNLWRGIIDLERRNALRSLEALDRSNQGSTA